MPDILRFPQAVTPMSHCRSRSANGVAGQGWNTHSFMRPRRSKYHNGWIKTTAFSGYGWHLRRWLKARLSVLTDTTTQAKNPKIQVSPLPTDYKPPCPAPPNQPPRRAIPAALPQAQRTQWTCAPRRTNVTPRRHHWRGHPPAMTASNVHALLHKHTHVSAQMFTQWGHQSSCPCRGVLERLRSCMAAGSTHVHRDGGR